MKFENQKLKTIALIWTLVALVFLVALYFSVNSKFDEFVKQVDAFNKILTFYLTPLALFSVWLSFVQWKSQKDKEIGYKDLQVDEPEENNKEQATIELGTPASPVSPATVNKLTIFKTSMQETILKVRGDTITCEIIDNRPGRGGHQWSLNSSEIKNILKDPLLNIKAHGYKQKTGLIDIGPRKNWLFSKRLHSEQELEAQIKQLLEAAVQK